MEIIQHTITRHDLKDRYTTSYPTVVKAVVDIRRGVIAVDAEWHADLELLLLDDGSRQPDLWGINLNVLEPPARFIAFESLINLRPAQSNFSMEIQDPMVIDAVKSLVDSLVDYGQVTGVREPVANYDSPARSGFGTPTIYPCLKHHRQLTMEKWRSFSPKNRVLMIANEFGRAKTLLPGGWGATLRECYERALELFHITIEAGRAENISPKILARLLQLRERTAELLVGQMPDEEKNGAIRDALIETSQDALERGPILSVGEKQFRVRTLPI